MSWSLLGVCPMNLVQWPQLPTSLLYLSGYLVPVRLSPRPSRSIRFGDVSEIRNGLTEIKDTERTRN